MLDMLMLVTIMICYFIKSLRCIPSSAVYSTVILLSYRHYCRIVQYRGIFCIPNLLLAGQAPISGHPFPTPLVAAYKNYRYSRKRPAPVTDIFIASRGCPLTRAKTVTASVFEKSIHCCDQQISNQLVFSRMQQ